MFAELGHQLTANQSLERKLDNLAKHCAYDQSMHFLFCQPASEKQKATINGISKGRHAPHLPLWIRHSVQKKGRQLSCKCHS